MGSQSFSGPPYRHPAILAGQRRWWTATVLTSVLSMPVIILAGMLSFAWLTGIGPQLEALSTWVLSVMTWFVAIVTDASYAIVGWLTVPAWIGLGVAFVLWTFVVAPRITASPATIAYVSWREHHLDVQMIDRWMRNPDENLRARVRNRYAGELFIELLTKTLKSAAAGLFTAGLIIAVTFTANLTGSGLWGSIAFVVAVIIAFLIYFFIFEFIPQAQIESAAHQKEMQDAFNAPRP